MLQFFLMLCLTLSFSGCSKPSTNEPQASSIETVVAEAEQKNSEEKSDNKEAQPKTFKPFYIYADKGSHQNHYIPSGFMPDGKCIVINDANQDNCASGETCIKVIFDVPCAKENQKWAGVYWQYPANNWGQRKGGYNLTGATQLKFMARGERGGEQIQEFLMGGILGNYPDSDLASVGPVILTPEWKEYTIDLRGKDLSYINGGFSWTTNVESNPESCIFYIDDIRFE